MSLERHDGGVDSCAESHRHRVNRVLHAVGFPIIAGCALAAL